MKKFIKIFFKISLLFVVIAFIGIGILVADAFSVNLNDKKLSGNLYDMKFYDNKEQEIITTDLLYNNKSGENLPEHTYNAFIAIEDKRFYNHKGVDLKRILKAAWNNLKSVSFKEGASTISQQLIKNTQLNSNKNLFRKSREIKLALDLERKYSKKEILDMYLNIIYFGSGCYGIENASRYYFNKPSKQLTINESAALATIIKAPNYYSPFSNYDIMLVRKNVVLRQMFENNLISEAEYYENKGKDIVLCKAENNENSYNDYIKVCLYEISDILNIPLKELQSLSCNIYTYMDVDKQKNLQNTLNNKNYYKDFNSIDSAAIVINNGNYSVNAISVNSMFPFNKITRQPGSAIKPVLVYAPAVEYNMLSPVEQLFDEKTNFEGYSPKNYNDNYYGYVSARNCLAKSLNVPAVKILNSVGIEKSKLFAKRCGIEFTEADNNLGLALGGFSEGVNLKELAGSYIPFANCGLYKKPQFIKMIKDENGKIIYRDNKEAVRVMREDTAYLISDMLKESVKSGTANKLNTFNFQLCSKTGTVGNSKYNTDAYNISYTSENTFAVWIGALGEKKLDLKMTGGTYPTLIMKDIIKNHYGKGKPADFIRPNSITECEIDTENLNRNHTVKLSTEMTPEKYVKSEIFSIHNMPNEYSNFFLLPTVEEAEIKYDKGKISIKFNAKNYLKYDIIKTDAAEDKIIDTVSDREGNVEIEDNLISYGKTYRYSIVPHFENKKYNKTIKGNIFMSNKILVPYKFSPEDDKLFEDDFDNLWWNEDDFIDFD